MLQSSVNMYNCIFIQANSTPVQLNTTAKNLTGMSMSAAAADSNDTAVNSIALRLVCSGKIEIRLI